MENLEEKVMRNGAYSTMAPAVRGRIKLRDGFLKTDFSCYSGLCWHKNWFGYLNRYVSVSWYNI